MNAFNLVMRATPAGEAESFYVMLSNELNQRGLFLCKIFDESFTERFFISESEYSIFEYKLKSAINTLGQFIHYYEIQVDKKTKDFFEKLKYDPE